MWDKIAQLGSLGRTVVIGAALAVLSAASGASYWAGNQIGRQHCINKSIEELRFTLDAEREAQRINRKAAAIHARALEEIREKYEGTQRQLEAARRVDADCDSYLSRPEHSCARDYLFGLPVPAAPAGGD